MRVIAIDGPAGSGKSTVARRLADRLELPYLDTGAMYRAVAFAALRRGIDPGESESVARITRDLELRGGGVVEGRDIGTVVLPAADLKAYLTANHDVRAGRRHKEVTDLDYETVAADMARRDAIDSEREVNPLRVANDAVVIDTSDREVDDIVSELMERLA